MTISEIENKTNILLSVLLIITILLMIAIIGLFIQMNQLQNKVIAQLSAQEFEGQEIGIKLGTEVPELELFNLAGDKVTLRDFRGDWVLLGFTSINCSVCGTTYPHIKEFNESREDVQIVLVSQGSYEETKKMVRDQGFSFPVLILDDNEFEVIQKFQVPGTPFFYLIDKNGEVRSLGFVNTQEHINQMVEGAQK